MTKNPRVHHTARMHVGPMIDPIELNLREISNNEEINEFQHDEDLLDAEGDEEEVEVDEEILDAEANQIIQEMEVELAQEIEELKAELITVIQAGIAGIEAAREEMEEMKVKWYAEVQKNHQLEISLAIKEAEKL